MKVCGSSYQQECIQSLERGGGEDEGDVNHGRAEYEEMIGRDDFHEYVDHYENVDNVHNDVVDDHDDNAMEFHNDIGDHIGAQHVTNTILTYEAHGPSFHANT